MLLVGAGLLIRSFVRLQQVSPGFNPDHVISMRLGAGNHHFQGNAAAIQFYRQVSEKIAAVPGVKAQGSVSNLPFTSSVGWGQINVEGFTPQSGQELQVDLRSASPDYFRAMGIPLLKGRFFSDRDTEPNAPQVVIVDEKFAHRFWSRQDPVGKHVWFDPKKPIVAAGVIGAVKHGGLFQEPAVRPGRGSADKGITAGSKEDPAAFERGAKAYTQNCAGCHGAAGRGSAGAPDLVRSVLVLDDEKGILIAPVLRDGRPDAGMPKMNLTEAQIADIVAWLHVQTYAAGHRTTYAYQDVLTGDAKKGETYFNATCKGCHSATGDLKGIGARYDAFALQSRWLQPRGGRGGGGRGGRGGAATSGKSAITVTVTLPSGEKISGVLDRVDDFSVSLHDSSGEYRSFTREGSSPKVEIYDPLKPHVDLLGKYTDPDIHNVTAYLVTLK